MADTNRKALGHLMFCKGCCCGRTDRAKPELPDQFLKDTWKAEKLNASIQLTISGCLGPCDRTNVTLLLTPTGQTWLGGLEGQDKYDAFADWARACKAAGEIQPLPEALAGHAFERW